MRRLIASIGWNGRMCTNRGFVRSVSWTTGILAALVLLAVPRAQELPVAPYEEVKPWGPGKAGSFDWEPAGADTDRQGRVYFLRRSDPAIWVMEPSGKVVRSFGDGL